MRWHTLSSHILSSIEKSTGNGVILSHEQFVTNTYRQAYNYVNPIDPQAALIIQDFLREQIDEEAQAKTIIDRLKLTGNNPSALLLIDQELGTRINAATPPAAG
ncbi:ferritin-like domain-containing protein [Mesobacillus subterraneus]|uniref:ferritin-like domain-containing protein n=1 Tax=Mesobacillus subterraneus TaxID=285983 RepID=UPI00353205AE